MGNEQHKIQRRSNSQSSYVKVNGVGSSQQSESVFRKFARAAQKHHQSLNASFRSRYKAGYKTDNGVAFLDSLFLPAFPIKGDEHNIDFEVLELIATGAFGNVLKAKCLQDEATYAMKVMKKAKILVDRAVQQCKDEAVIHNAVGDHTFIVKPHWIFQNKDDVFIVMDYVPQGELFTAWKQHMTFTEDTIRVYVAELALVLDYLHSSGIIYRDLKMENILLDAYGHLRVVDFGLAKWLPRGQRTRTICGTLHYIAPEVLSSRPYGHTSDWWSIGILMYALLAGQFPVKRARTPNEMYERVKTSVYDLPFDKPYSWQARKCCKRLLKKDHRHRIHSLAAIKNQAFFNQFDFDGLLINQSTYPVYLEQKVPSVRTRRPRYQSSLIDMFLEDTLVHTGRNGYRTDSRDTHRRSRSVDGYLDVTPMVNDVSVFSLDSQPDEMDNPMSRSIDCELDVRHRESKPADDRANQSAHAILDNSHRRRHRRKPRRSSEHTHSHCKVSNDLSLFSVDSNEPCLNNAMSRSVDFELDERLHSTPNKCDEHANQSAYAILDHRKHGESSANKPLHSSNGSHSRHKNQLDMKFAWNESVASQDGSFV